MPLSTSDRLEQALNHVDKAITSALNTSLPKPEVIRGTLSGLDWLPTTPLSLIKMTYGWCNVIWENRQSCEGWESILLLSLEVGFRYFDRLGLSGIFRFDSIKLHAELVETVFKSDNGESIADLLLALILLHSSKYNPVLGNHSQHIVDLQDGVTVYSSSRLRRYVTHAIECIGYEGFKEVGVGRFAGLLNQLHKDFEEQKHSFWWFPTLLETIQSPGGVRCLAIGSWKVLVELAICPRFSGGGDTAYTPQVTTSLLEAQEWDKLECWIGCIWMEWAPETDNATEDLIRTMTLLFRQRPGAPQKLAEWMERWVGARRRDEVLHRSSLASFERICKCAQEEALVHPLYVSFDCLTHLNTHAVVDYFLDLIRQMGKREKVPLIHHRPSGFHLPGWKGSGRHSHQFERRHRIRMVLCVRCSFILYS